jgi:hypothetical protein
VFREGIRESHRTVRIKDKRVGLRLLYLKKRRSLRFVLQPVPDEKGRARLQPLRDVPRLRPEIAPRPVKFDLRKIFFCSARFSWACGLSNP